MSLRLADQDRQALIVVLSHRSGLAVVGALRGGRPVAVPRQHSAGGRGGPP
ncbi:hypothetical protein OG275_37845 [Streptomyces niveus]|uniref:hypothetical protein n=1 Tax=Streptomyces niveus TaxID=193462 RepID=UPI002E36C14F|nr:hypothetical protein [Streptomyces niveus]